MRFLKVASCLAVGVAMATTASAATLLTDVSKTSSNARGLQTTIDDFRSALGDNNGNAPVNADPNGRRQINWDAAPDAISDPNPFPGDFFNGDADPRARGIEFSETGATTSFLLSSTEASGQPPRFGFPGDLVPFSEERMFSPVGGTTFDVEFFDPATQINPATTRGLGIIFNDVGEFAATTMTLFDVDGNELATRRAALGAGGLSFLGLIFDEAVIAKASINVGTAALLGNGVAGVGDLVVMDDYIFGEPVPVSAVPLPAGVLLLLTGLLAVGGLASRRL